MDFGSNEGYHVYRYQGNLDGLRIGLRLRLRRTHEIQIPQGYGMTYEYEIGWQDRIASVQDLIAQVRNNEDGAREKLEKICNILEERRHFVYTYTDEDGFRSWNTFGQSILRNAMNQAAPSIQTSTGALNASLATLQNMSHFRKDSVQHALRIQNREAVATRFYVMCAVDPDVALLRQFCRHPLSVPKFENAPFNEIVLCACAAYEDFGRLDMSPGFAVPDLSDLNKVFLKKEQNDDDFIQDDHIGTGLPLVTTRLVSPRDRDTFEFVFERLEDDTKAIKTINALPPIPSKDELPAHFDAKSLQVAPDIQFLVEDMFEDAENVNERYKRFQLKLQHVPLQIQTEPALSTYQVAFGIQMEIVRAEGFEDADWLSIDYEIHLPGHGWRALENDVLWTSTIEGDQMCTGTTQVSGICAKQNYNDDRTSTFIVIAVCALFLFGILAGPSYSLFLIFGFFLTTLSYGAHPNLYYQQDKNKAAAYFNYPIELKIARLYAMNDPRDAIRPTEIPRCYFQVWSRAAFSERYVVEGYAQYRLPTTDSTNQFNQDEEGFIFLDVWKPIPNLRAQLRDFFVGGAARLIDMRSAAYPLEDQSSHIGRGVFRSLAITSKLNLRTERTGTIVLRFCMRKATRPIHKDISKTRTEILNSIEKQKRLKSISQLTSSLLSNEDQLLSKKTIKSLREKFAQRTNNLTDHDALKDVLAGLRATIAGNGQGHSHVSADLIARDTTRPARERAAELIRLLQNERNALRPYRMGVQVPNPMGTIIDHENNKKEDDQPVYSSATRRRVVRPNNQDNNGQEGEDDDPPLTSTASSDGGWAESKEAPLPSITSPAPSPSF